MRYLAFVLCATLAALVDALPSLRKGSDHSHASASGNFNKGIKVPKELRARSRQSSERDEKRIFNPGGWFALGNPATSSVSPSATSHAKLAPAPGNSSSPCEALFKMYTDMGGSGWHNQTGWKNGGYISPTSTVCCSWYGISCKGGVVSTIDVEKNGLVGPLSPALFTLPGLENM